MNYEEMVNAQESTISHKEEVSVGLYYRRMYEGKYRYVVDLLPSLIDNIAFCQGLKTDQQLCASVNSDAQLHYELQMDDSGPYRLLLEPGSYLTFNQLIDSNPAVVAGPRFIDNTVERLFSITEQLHNQGVYQLNYSPNNVFVRRGDQAVMLLYHGSSFSGMSNFKDLFCENEQFVAPEVLEEGEITEASDVYALARFIEWLYQNGDMPVEYKRIIAKATQEDPSKRYYSIADMRSALNKTRGMKRSAITFAAALAVVLLCMGLYFELMPQTDEIEFVEAAPKTDTDDLLDQGFNEETELGLWVDTDTLTDAERAQMDEYLHKAEEIFRRQYTKEANRIMSKLYSKEGMSLSENTFIASSNAMTQELIQAQKKLAGEAGISDDVSVKIASEINDRLSAEMQKKVVKYGVQKESKEDNEEQQLNNKTNK